jgi:hypothetical protein
MFDVTMRRGNGAGPSTIKQAKPAKASNLTTASIDNNMFTFSFVAPPPQQQFFATAASEAGKAESTTC